MPWTSSTQQHGWQTLTGSAGPLYHLGLSLSTQGHSEEDLTHTPPLRVVIPADDAPEARHLLQTGRDALAFYYQQFALSLRAPLLTVVVHERDLSVPFSAVADNMVFLARDLVRVPALAHKFPEFVLARGLAQQWWGLRTAYNLRTERWVGEGLATYMAARWLEYTYGRGRTFIAWKAPWLPNLSFWEQHIDIPYRLLVADVCNQHMTTPGTRPQIGVAPDLRKKEGAMRHVVAPSGSASLSTLFNTLQRLGTISPVRMCAVLLRPQRHFALVLSAMGERASGSTMPWGVKPPHTEASRRCIATAWKYAASGKPSCRSRSD